MTKITSAIAAAFIASASFATAALADEGDYYEGVAPTQQTEGLHAAQVDRFGYTGSISRAAGAGRDANGSVVLDRGDYYEGANRPN